MTELEFMEKVLHELDQLKGIGIGVTITVLAIWAFVLLIHNKVNSGKK